MNQPEAVRKLQEALHDLYEQLEHYHVPWASTIADAAAAAAIKVQAECQGGQVPQAPTET